jgi:hypothetical protein
MLFDRASIIFTEVVNKYITEMSKEELILPVTEEEITASIASINNRKSADFHNSTIEHILHAGENIITVLTHIWTILS